jgi:serine/threonine protein kinase
VLLKDLPLQALEEKIVEAIALAKTERRLKDLKALKEQKESMAYIFAGLTAKVMRERLIALKAKLEERIDELMDSDDDDGCIICDEYQAKIQEILDQNIPVATSPVSVSSSAKVAPSVPGVAGSTDSVVLERSVSEGENSSGKSIILSGIFTAAHTTEQVSVMVKVSDKSLFSRAQKEYSMMARLHKADPSRFVRPFAFLDGSQGCIIPHQKEDAEYCLKSVCIVMEKGAVDMKQYFTQRPDMPIMEKLAVVRQLLDILIAARKCGVVLNDFKLANIVRVSDGRYDFTLKAIDFDNSCVEGESMSDETTAAYCPPEVAKIALARCKGEQVASLLATHKMDIMALGFTVYEIANDMVSYWSNQTNPISGDLEILKAISILTDEDVHKNVNHTFPGDQYAALRTWLFHALRVNPRERATAEELLHSHSLFGSKDRTLDPNQLLSKIEQKIDRSTDKVLEQGKQILTRVEELSQQLDSSLSVFGSALDDVAARIALGASQNSSDMKAVGEVLQHHRDLLQKGETLDQHRLEAALKAAMGNMEESLKAEINSSISGVIAAKSSASDPSHEEKLDALLDMVTDLKRQTDSLTREFKDFSKLSESQHELLSVLERDNNSMPLTFVILPGTEPSVKLAPSSSMIEKMKNSARRRKDQILELVWARSRVVFICPVTLQQVCTVD